MDDNPAKVVMDDNRSEVVMGDKHSELNKSVISGHYDLSGSCVKPQIYINATSAYLLDLTNEAILVNKGIKVSPGDEFHYTQETRSSLYVFEAGVAPTHAATIRKHIQIYVIWEEKKILVATLSSANPKVQLDLVMSEGMQLSHTSVTKVVYFNACELKPLPLFKEPMPVYKDSIFRTDKEIWVTGVKPEEEVILNPEDNKKYYLLRVFPAEHTIEEIDLHVQCGDKHEKIGVLQKDRTFYCNLEFEGTFTLSHTSKVADVIFYGYTVSNMLTVELPDPPNPETLLKRRPPKQCDDPEYEAYVAKRGKVDMVRRLAHKLTNVLLVPTPLISCSH